MDDRDLIRGFQAGDEACFTELVARHRQRAYRVARAILRDHQRADDAAQEALVKAHRGLSSFKGDAAFTTWLHRITVNVALDIRQGEVRERRARDATKAAAHEARPSPGSDGVALDRLVRAEELAMLRAAVAELPDRQRLTLTLRVHEGLKYREIADVLECPVGTVKANFHHAVQNLRKILARSGVAGRAATAGSPGSSRTASGDGHDT